jgi:hypothetical protein
MSEPKVSSSELAGFFGTEQWYKHPLVRGLLFTDGIAYLCTHGAGWVVDAVASYQTDPRILRDLDLRMMQFWKLTVADGKAKLICVRDSGQEPTITQEWTWTDFPLAELEIWVKRDEQAVTMFLPSEY